MNDTEQINKIENSTENYKYAYKTGHTKFKKNRELVGKTIAHI